MSGPAAIDTRQRPQAKAREVAEDWGPYNRAVRRAASPLVPTWWTVVGGAALGAALAVAAMLVLVPEDDGADAAPVAKAPTPAEPPMLRIHPDDLAKLRVGGDAPAPAAPPAAGAADGGNSPRVVTNFSVFKSVRFLGGRVVTEWAYDSSEAPAPSRQNCFFGRSEDTAEQLQRLARNGRLIAFDPANPMRLGHADWQQAVALCQWFPGGAR